MHMYPALHVPYTVGVNGACAMLLGLYVLLLKYVPNLQK